MIKNFATILIFGFICQNLIAQNFGGGFLLGLSTSQVSGDDLGGFNKAGLTVGVFANRKISPTLTFQMEMTYIEKGSNNPKINDYEHPNNGIADISMSYFAIPLLLKYHQSSRIKIEGGVEASYLISGYYNDSNGKLSYLGINPFTKYELGCLIGLDYKYTRKISLNTRMSNSILPIGVEDYQGIDTYNSNKKGKYNSVLSFTLNYNF